MVWDNAAAFVVQLRWRPIEELGERSMFRVLRFEAGKIREIADCRTLAAASRSARRFAAYRAD